ncbi:MAG: metal transporter ATPase, partial [Pseudomonadota bacterium]
MNSPAELTSLQIPIVGMTCGNCALRVEKALAARAGVHSAHVNFATESASVRFEPALLGREQLTEIIEEAGYHVGEPASGPPSLQGSRTPAAADDQASASPSSSPLPPKASSGASPGRAPSRESRDWVLAAVLTLPLVAPMLVMPFGIHWQLPGWVQWSLATPVQFYVGARFYRGAYFALRGGVANMDVLVALGTSAAYLLSVWLLQSGGHLYFESSAAIITFVCLGKWLEARAKRSTTAAIRSLMQLRPEQARVERAGNVVLVSPDEVQVGEVVLVKPGERVPVDGKIIRGESQLDESLITGESLPVSKAAGASVSAGSMNGDGLIAITVQHVGEDTTLSRIIRLVQDAQSKKA